MLRFIPSSQIQKVENDGLRKRYDRRKEEVSDENSRHDNERFFFHGSPFVHTIIQKGFDERHAYMGGMFGAGKCFGELSEFGCVWLSTLSRSIGHVNRIPAMQFFTEISRNSQSKSYMLSLTECVWDF